MVQVKIETSHSPQQIQNKINGSICELIDNGYIFKDVKVITDHGMILAVLLYETETKA